LDDVAGKADPMRNSRSISGIVIGGLKGILSRIPQTPLALRRRGREHLAAGNISEASLFADRLARIDLRRAIHLRGEILLQSQPQHDHTAFWSEAAARFPNDGDFVRKTIHAALKAGKAEAAWSSLRVLIENRRTKARDGNFVIGLVNIYSAQADWPKLRLVVRQFLRSLYGKPDYRIAAVRLSRIIFVYFPRAGSPAGDKTGRDFGERFLKMLERSAVSPEPKSILRRVVALERALASSVPMALFDTDISRDQCLRFVGLVHDRLASGTGFSFIRVGDGESSCLAYERHLSQFEEVDIAERERAWWGAELAPSDRARISGQVSSAIWNADCVGIPTVSRILRDVKLSEDDQLGGGRTGRGLRSIIHTFENGAHAGVRQSARQCFTSCHLHQDLSRWNLYPQLFKRSGEVVLISCHPELAATVQQRFGVRVAGNILVPPRFATIPLLRQKPAISGALPEVMEGVAEELGDLPRNRLVLVGAGYLGKRLVDLAKQRGGVALDLGSIFDHWIGINTRSYQDLASK
jgi:hypothetical protein